MRDAVQPSAIGHNSSDVKVRIEVRFFNSLAKYNDEDGVRRTLETAAGTTVGEIIRRFKLPLPEIFLVLKNGRDITPGLYQGGVVNEEVVVEDGDTIAFSGPVPYSPGFGAPVV